jgi:hypothetical protein
MNYNVGAYSNRTHGGTKKDGKNGSIPDEKSGRSVSQFKASNIMSKISAHNADFRHGKLTQNCEIKFILVAALVYHLVTVV